MREIKFRGKDSITGEWVYGDLSTKNLFNTTLIYREEWWDVEVDPETVGQYTGLKDKNGVEIYEGDVVNRRSGEYWQGCYEFDDTITISDLMDIVTTAEFESLLVIDNIHNNPEPLGGAE